MRQHDFTYTRLVNDIPYIANGFNITVDAETGAITFYRMRWHDRDFPSPEGVVEKVKAEAYFLEDVGLELVYTPLYNPKSRKSEYKLVYKIKPANSYVFDAFDFKPLDYSGKPIEKETETTFSDIKGHWAQGDIQLLVDLGIIKSEEDKFKPDENTTEGNFIKLLMISKNHRISDNIPIPIIKLESDGAKTDEEIQKYIDAAIKLGWAKPGEVNAQNPLSREKAAVFVVRAMGFDKVASLSDIYKDIAEDASIVKPEYKGHVTIALGLKLLSTDSGGFKPKTPVSNAQAATILVRMLKLDS